MENCEPHNYKILSNYFTYPNHTNHTILMSLPRYCSIVNNEITINPQYVRCLLNDEEVGDRLYISSVVKGVMLSSKIYPLIYDTEDTTDTNWQRSINKQTGQIFNDKIICDEFNG